jgi:hypothetical protein
MEASPIIWKLVNGSRGVPSTPICTHSRPSRLTLAGRGSIRSGS